MKLLPLDSPAWSTYSGGYRQPFSALPLVRELMERGTSAQFWDTVWSELYHQGDVGESSYALVPYLVHYQAHQPELEWQLFQFVWAVELARPESDNPAIPEELELSYAMSLRSLPAIGVDKIRRGCDEAVLMGVCALVALAAGHRVLARTYLELGRTDALKYLHELNGFEPGEHDD